MITSLCISIVILIFFIDMRIKNEIERSVMPGQTKPKWNGRILIRKHYNRGAFLNAGQKKPQMIRILSVILTVLALILFLCSLGQKGNHTLRIGLAFLLGGAFSNTYDRLKRRYVVDYLSFGVKWKWLRNMIFNVADFAIMIGALTTVFGAGR